MIINDETWDVIYIKLADKFGDSGIVGTCIIKYDGTEAIIDTFLLSCRVIGRGIEDVFLAEAINLSRMKGIKFVIGEYYETKKNKQVEYFFSAHGFEEVSVDGSSLDRKFVYDMKNNVIKNPDYFKKIISSIGR